MFDLLRNNNAADQDDRRHENVLQLRPDQSNLSAMLTRFISPRLMVGLIE